MSKYLLLFSLFIGFQSFGQLDEQEAFDFWVGEWDAYWKPNDSTLIRGENIITKTCDGKVLYENFSDPTNELYGNSLTVWSTSDSLWHQVWTDNKGGYLELTGIIDGDKRILQTEPEEIEGKTVIKRMVFQNIEEDSFKWNWEISIDGGESWNLRWQILYQRKNKD